MISLKDEISKFQKMVFNKQLSEFVTVDQMFVGGGITMESIIHESNFVVEELKKMNAVFRNYCKLNEKVYTKIMEHQLSVHSEQARLNALASSVDRKIQQTLKKLKEIHQDTIVQNQKSHNLIYESIEPIKLQLDQKVDLSTFTEKMKRFLEDYDEGEEAKGSDTYQERMNNGVQGQPGENAQNSPYPKKKGKVSYDQFYKFRTQLDNILKNSDEKAVEFGKQGIQAKELIIKYIPTINTLLSQTNEQRNQIYKLNGVQIEHATQLSASMSKIYSQLNSRLNDQVWNSKFDSFFEKQIKPIASSLQVNLKKQHDKINSYKEESGTKFKQIDSQLLKNKSAFAIAKKDIQMISTQSENTKQQLKSYMTKQQMQNLKVNKQIQSISVDLKKKFQQLEKKTQKEYVQINTIINNLSVTIQQSVMKSVNKRFQKQLKIIEDSIKQNLEIIKHINNDVGLITQQIKHIKDLLSQKANFTDIILHVQKKADKEDFRQLQFKFQETSQQFYAKNLNQSINLSKIQKTQSASTRRIPSLTRTSKTLLVPQTVNNRTQKLDFDTGTKMFMCGFEGHLTDSRKQSSQNTRRKNMKSSSTAIVGDFVL